MQKASQFQFQMGTENIQRDVLNRVDGIAFGFRYALNSTLLHLLDYFNITNFN